MRNEPLSLDFALGEIGTHSQPSDKVPHVFKLLPQYGNVKEFWGVVGVGHCGLGGMTARLLLVAVTATYSFFVLQDIVTLTTNGQYARGCEEYL